VNPPAPAHGSPLALAATLVGCFLLAAAVRLPGLGARRLGEAEQTAFVESQGFRARAPVPFDRPLTKNALPRSVGLLEVGRGASGPPLHAVGLALWTRAAGTSETALRVPSELAGALAAALAALVAGQIAGPWAAAWAGGLVALSPIHTLASRDAGPNALLVLLLLASLALALRIESTGGRAAAALLGLPLGLLASSGIAAFATLALLPLVWLVFRPDRRAAAGWAAVTTLAVVAVAASMGLARSPLDFGEIPTWIPEATASGILRCAGASFTRVAGIEYHLAFSQAREVIPLTALFVGLMARGAASLPARARGLLVAGALLPFALGAALALAAGRVTPLQAPRLLAGLPCVAVLMAVGLASLRGLRSWAAGAAVGGALVSFLTLALVRPDGEASPTQALAQGLARCRSGSTVVALQRPLDLLALAAWGVPGPFVLRAVRAPVPDGPAIVVSPSSACVGGGASCDAIPACDRR
jgi:hypothetical protein